MVGWRVYSQCIASCVVERRGCNVIISIRRKHTLLSLDDLLQVLRSIFRNRIGIGRNGTRIGSHGFEMRVHGKECNDDEQRSVCGSP